MLRAVREDEDAARALGKNAFAYKLQSLAIVGGARGDRRLVPGAQARDRSTRSSFEPLFTFFGYAILVLGGLASFWGVMVGAVIFWTLARGHCASSSSPLDEVEIGGAALRRSSA